jgi:hypothetical protein
MAGTIDSVFVIVASLAVFRLLAVILHGAGMLAIHLMVLV